MPASTSMARLRVWKSLRMVSIVFSAGHGDARSTDGPFGLAAGIGRRWLGGGGGAGVGVTDFAPGHGADAEAQACVNGVEGDAHAEQVERVGHLLAGGAAERPHAGKVGADLLGGVKVFVSVAAVAHDLVRDAPDGADLVARQAALLHPFQVFAGVA